MDHYQPKHERLEVKKSEAILYCKFFLDGSCTYGEVCKFAHIDPKTCSTEPIGLLVEHIPYGTKESDLFHLFSQYGNTKDVQMIDEGSESNPYSVAHVDMIGRIGAQNALRELNQWDNPNQLTVTVRGSQRPYVNGGPVRRDAHAPGGQMKSSFPPNRVRELPSNNVPGGGGGPPRDVGGFNNYGNNNNNFNDNNNLSNNNFINNNNNNNNFNNASSSNNFNAPIDNTQRIINRQGPNNNGYDNVNTSFNNNSNNNGSFASNSQFSPNVQQRSNNGFDNNNLNNGFNNNNNMNNDRGRNDFNNGNNRNNFSNNNMINRGPNNGYDNNNNSFDNNRFNNNNNNNNFSNNNLNNNNNNNNFNNNNSGNYNNNNFNNNNDDYQSGNRNFNNNNNTDNYRNVVDRIPIPPRAAPFSPRDMPRDPREIPRDMPREIPREMPRDPRNIPRDMPRDPRDIQRDIPTYQAPVDDTFERRLCRHYSAGKCTFGDKCSFSHGTPSLREPVHERPYPNPPRDSFVASAYEPEPYRPREPTYDPSRERRKGGPRPEKYRTAICQNFGAGKCAFGDKCDFIH
jgi:hypothetical protein